CSSSSSSPRSGAPRSSCISAQRTEELTSTSVQPAWRCRYESLPGWSRSKLWCACLIRDTLRPPPTMNGISCSMRVVLPLPDPPAKPKIFISVILVPVERDGLDQGAHGEARPQGKLLGRAPGDARAQHGAADRNRHVDRAAAVVRPDRGDRALQHV